MANGSDRSASLSFPSGRYLLDVEGWTRVGRALKLSERELQLSKHVFDDNKVLTIADDLGISVHTINTYFHRLYAKLNVSSRAQLIIRILTEHFAMAAAAERSPVPNSTLRQDGGSAVTFIDDGGGFDLPRASSE